MKKNLIAFLAGMIAVVVTGAVIQQSTSLYLLDVSNDNETKLKIRAASTQSNPFIEVVSGGTTVWGVDAGGTMMFQSPYSNRVALGISETSTNSGIGLTNGTAYGLTLASVYTNSGQGYVTGGRLDSGNVTNSLQFLASGGLTASAAFTNSGTAFFTGSGLTISAPQTNSASMKMTAGVTMTGGFTNAGFQSTGYGIYNVITNVTAIAALSQTNYFVMDNTKTAGVTNNLPSLANVTIGTAYVFCDYFTNANTFNIKLVPSGAELINGAASLVISAAGGTKTLVAVQTNLWFAY